MERLEESKEPDGASCGVEAGAELEERCLDMPGAQGVCDREIPQEEVVQERDMQG